MDAQVILETQKLDEVANEIRDRLLRFNQERAGPFHDVRLVLTARGVAGELLGGLVGLGFWNGLFIDLVWYEPFGELKGMPPGHSRSWFAKWLR